MWLFDDILKKPEHTGTQADPLSGVSGGTTPTGSGQPPQDDTPIIIQKSSEETLFGAETEAKAIDAMNATANPPMIHAEDDTSSIMMRSQTVDTPTIMTTVAPTLETPIISEPVAMAVPVMTETPVVSVPTLETPIAAAPIMDMTPAAAPSITVAPTHIVDSTVETMPITTTPAPSGSIFDSIMTETVATPSTPVTTQTESTPLENLWSEAPTPVVTPTVAVETPVAAPAPIMQTESIATHNFTTPREFLEKSIANIDIMLGNIDTRHAAKEAEELGYKMEKLRYTELEKTAHTEKIIMDKERDHAIAMRKMLEKEIEKDEENKKHVTSVESTLTDIGAKHPVHKHHKAEHTEA